MSISLNKISFFLSFLPSMFLLFVTSFVYFFCVPPCLSVCLSVLPSFNSSILFCLSFLNFFLPFWISFLPLFLFSFVLSLCMSDFLYTLPFFLYLFITGQKPITTKQALQYNYIASIHLITHLNVSLSYIWVYYPGSSLHSAWSCLLPDTALSPWWWYLTIKLQRTLPRTLHFPPLWKNYNIKLN